MTKREEFVRATDSEDWRTLEEIAQALDWAGYWRDQLPEGDKQKHVLEMIIRGLHKEGAPGLYDVANNRLTVDQHAFAFAFMANESGEVVPLYKPIRNLTFSEVEEMAEQHKALDAYDEERLSDAKYALSVAEDLLEELSEETMSRAWPGVSHHERRRIVQAALIQYRQFEAAKRRFTARLLDEGFDLDRYTREYMRAAGACRSNATLSYIYDDFAEYMKVALELQAVNFVEINLGMFLEAYMYTLYKFAQREGISMREAAQVFGGEFGEHVNLFVEALSQQELFEGTLEEHLQFAVEDAEARAS